MFIKTVTFLVLLNAALFSQEDGKIYHEEVEGDSSQINLKLQIAGNYYHPLTELMRTYVKTISGWGGGIGLIVTLSEVFDIEGLISFDKINTDYKFSETTYTVNAMFCYAGFRIYPYRGKWTFYYGLGASSDIYTESLENRQQYLDKEYTLDYASLAGKVGFGYSITSNIMIEISSSAHYNFTRSNIDRIMFNVGIVWDI